MSFRCKKVEVELLPGWEDAHQEPGASLATCRQDAVLQAPALHKFSAGLGQPKRPTWPKNQMKGLILPFFLKENQPL